MDVLENFLSFQGSITTSAGTGRGRRDYNAAGGYTFMLEEALVLAQGLEATLRFD